LYGSNEYFSKPLDLDLLTVRVANLIARAGGTIPMAEPESIGWGDLAVFPDEHRVALKNKNIALTHLEFKLLVSFMRQPNRVLPRSWLLQTVWESTSSVTTRTVDKHIESLRKKIPPLASRLETVVGVGYLFRP
jgi:DNA-binding response OmpR family regulator